MHVFQLYKYLRSIRASYLSTTLPPHRTRNATHRADKERSYLTDVERDQIDTESKATLRDLNSGIRQLEQAEQLRKDTELQVAAKKKARHGFGRLGLWAAGDTAAGKSPEEILEEARQHTTNAYRESVIWYLRQKLGDAAETQRSMMETRLNRELEKSKSVLYKTKAQQANGGTNSAAQMLSTTEEPGFTGMKGVYSIEAQQRSIEASLSPEQLQVFAEENNEMLKHYEDTLDQVRTAERSMVEISELQSTLAANLEIQATRIDQMTEDAENTSTNIEGGNKQLKKASEKFRVAPYLFYVSCSLSAFLVVWDLIF